MRATPRPPLGPNAAAAIATLRAAMAAMPPHSRPRSRASDRTPSRKLQLALTVVKSPIRSRRPTSYAVDGADGPAPRIGLRWGPAACRPQIRFVSLRLCGACGLARVDRSVRRKRSPDEPPLKFFANRPRCRSHAGAHGPRPGRTLRPLERALRRSVQETPGAQSGTGTGVETASSQWRRLFADRGSLKRSVG